MTQNGNAVISQKQDSSPMFFISHDTKDFLIAEQFSKLLSNASTGIIESFRSSDNKTTQGVDYGVMWFSEIIKKLNESSGVICILTQNSINKPWILFEAGIFMGKSGPPIHAVALGISLKETSETPFAQFQICPEDVDSLSKLVTNLVKRIPYTKPSDEIIKFHVKQFLDAIQPSLKKQVERMPDETNKKDKINEDNSQMSKLFEEIKIMFQDLPTKIKIDQTPSTNTYELLKEVFEIVKKSKAEEVESFKNESLIKELLLFAQRAAVENEKIRKRELELANLPDSILINTFEQLDKNINSLRIQILNHLKNQPNKGDELTNEADKIERNHRKRLLFRPFITFLKDSKMSYDDFLKNATEIEKFYNIITKKKAMERKAFLNTISAYETSEILAGLKNE